jgi:hypothetical protein
MHAAACASSAAHTSPETHPGQDVHVAGVAACRRRRDRRRLLHHGPHLRAWRVVVLVLLLRVSDAACAAVQCRALCTTYRLPAPMQRCTHRCKPTMHAHTHMHTHTCTHMHTHTHTNTHTQAHTHTHMMRTHLVVHHNERGRPAVPQQRDHGVSERLQVHGPRQLAGAHLRPRRWWRMGWRRVGGWAVEWRHDGRPARAHTRHTRKHTHACVCTRARGLHTCQASTHHTCATPAASTCCRRSCRRGAGSDSAALCCATKAASHTCSCGHSWRQ